MTIEEYFEKNNLNTNDFDWQQLTQIEKGLEKGLDVSKYIDNKYHWEQMYQIRQGLQDGLDVSKYADHKLTSEQMRQIRYSQRQKIKTFTHFTLSNKDLLEKQNSEGKKYFLGNLSKNEKILIPHSFVKQKEEYGVITCPNNFQFKVLTNVLNKETNVWEPKTKLMNSFEIRKKIAKQKQLSETQTQSESKPLTYEWNDSKKLRM